jgi:hypothetical protein
LKQITEQYQSKFGVDQGRVVKVALVIARRSFVLASFEEACLPIHPVKSDAV